MMKPYFQDDAVTLHHGDALEVAARLETGSVDCIVTSESDDRAALARQAVARHK